MKAKHLLFLLSALLCVCQAYAQGQGFVVKGKVVDENGEPLIGAGVVTPDKKRGTVTDLNGMYSLQVQPSDKALVFSFLGYSEQEINIEGRNTIDVILLPDANNSINELVVIGYGTTKKQDLTGSVSTVKMTDIQSVPVTSVDQALQGRIAGVDIMNTTGEPGSATSIRVRGTRSITASNEPLIIVDGVMDAVESFGDINPDDIESISVLKDASSTAIYGSRGANGVIMITTRKGTTAKPVVRAKVTAGVSWISKHLDVMNAEEFCRYRNDFYYANGTNPAKQAMRYDPENYTDTNWIDAITRLAPYQNYSISASGKGKDYNFFSSLGYLDERGIVQDSGQKRVTGRLNFEKDFTKWLTVTMKANMTYHKQDRNKAVFSGSGYSNGAIYLPPVIGLLDNQNPFIDNASLINTPYASIKYEDYYNTGWNNQGLVGITIKPVKGLTIKSQNSITNTQGHVYHFWPNALPARYEEEGANAYKYEKETFNVSSENTVNYRRKINKKYTFDALLGYSATLNLTQNTGVTAKGIITDAVEWNNLNAISSKDGYNVTSGKTRILRQSVFGRFNYNYDNRYYLTATLRADGSSNFAENRKWGVFPSAAFKWNAKNEKFLKGVTWLSDLSLRLSAGRTGNDALAAYASQQAYASTTGSYLFDGNQGTSFYPSRLASPDLTWEKTDQFNAALESSFLNGRLNVTVEGYHSRTTDLLLQVSTLRSTGYANRYTNLGLTTNTGIECTIESRNIEKKNFGWTTMLTISHNRQMVDNVGHENYVASVYSPDGYMMYGYKAGYPLNALWGFENGGCVHNEQEYIDNQSSKQYAYRTSFANAKAALGQPRYVDQDHNGVIDQNDLVYLGNADPDVYGGIQNTFHFWNFKFSFYFAYSIGGKIYNYAEMYMGGSNYTNQYRYMLDCWHPVRNPESDIPIAGSSKCLLPSDNFVYDASYLRLKDLTLEYTYNAPKNFKVFRQMVVGVSANNLWLLSAYRGFDPDVSTESESSTLRRVDMNSYPTSRRVVFNLSLRF